MAAELLADRLLDIYQNEQVAEMVSQFAAAGFTRSALVNDTDALFRMVVIAAYDRRPFTAGAGGFENIWEMRRGADGVPSKLQRVGLWSAGRVLALSPAEIRERLARLRLGGLAMDSDGGNTHYAQTLSDAARLSRSGFAERLRQANTPQAIGKIFNDFDDVHGIGETIAAKLVKYTLREIDVGRARPEHFPLSVAWPLVEEWHAAGGVGKLNSLSHDLTPLTAAILLQRGDIFAIDGLFYLHRNHSWELDELVTELQQAWRAPASQAGRAALASLATAGRAGGASDASGKAICQALLAIIGEVRDDAESLTDGELRAKGITRDIMTASRALQSARKLYLDMAQTAQRNNPAEMVRFYENCLCSEQGKIYDWVLQEVGRKCLASEKERFMQVAQGASSQE